MIRGVQRNDITEEERKRICIRRMKKKDMEYERK